MKIVISIILLSILSVGLFAYSFIFGGSNLGYMGYPEFSDMPPNEPYTGYDKIISEVEYESYRREVEEFVENAKEYVENGNYDIKRIEEAQQEAIDKANEAIDDFNYWVNFIRVL